MAKFAPRPDSVKVGPHLFAINWMDESEWNHERLDDNTAGLTYSGKQTIFIRTSPDVNESQYQEVVLHEVTHAVWSVTMMTHTDLTELSDREEFIIAHQSPMLLQVFKDNPELVAYLMADGNKVR